jgi:transposase
VIALCNEGVVNIALCCVEWLRSLGKKLSKWTLIRILKAAEFSWRRVRKSLKLQRDAGMFDFFKLEIKALEREHQRGKIKLWYYDESGISLNPNSVYAWLPKENAYELPAIRGNVLTIAGFFQTDNSLQAYSHTGSMTSEIFITYVEDFLKNNPTSFKTVVIIDNASFHKSVEVKNQLKQWQKQNLFFQFLPPYCSELNKIEVLWHHLKHLWLRLEDYKTKESLKEAVDYILSNVKTKYTINFT